MSMEGARYREVLARAHARSGHIRRPPVGRRVLATEIDASAKKDGNGCQNLGASPDSVLIKGTAMTVSTMRGQCVSQS